MKANTNASEQDVGVRDLARNTKRVLEAVSRGTTFVVRVHGKPIARIVAHTRARGAKPALADLRALRTQRIRDKDLSKRIDAIVYRS